MIFWIPSIVDTGYTIHRPTEQHYCTIECWNSGIYMNLYLCLSFVTARSRASSVLNETDKRMREKFQVSQSFNIYAGCFCLLIAYSLWLTAYKE